jgi:hypothetical protein
MVFDIKSLDGQWHHIIHEFTGYSPSDKPGQPCPLCSDSSKSDRFHYTNRHHNGTWLCRQCTPDGSDGLGLIARLKRIDRKEAFKLVAKKYGRDDAPRYPKAEPEPEFIPGLGAAEWDGKTLANKLREDGSHKKYNFAYIWKWNDSDGSFYGYVARMEWVDKESGEPKKLPWQILYGHYEDQPDTVGWMQVAMNPKPLFGYPSCGLEGVNPKYIVIVEGEKTCMAAKKLLGPDYLILCCQGGSSNVRTTDFKPLISFAEEKRLPIIAWGDNDETGDKYAKELQQILNCFAVDNNKLAWDKPSGWDAADATEDETEDIKAALLEAVSSTAVEVKPEKNASEDIIADDETPTGDSIDALLRHVNPLGVCEGRYAFYPKNLKAVQFLSPHNLMQRATMLSIVGEDYLYKYFPKIDEETGEEKGYDYNKAGRYFMKQCHQRGTYDPDCMRGIGLWKDKKSMVVNTGAALVIDGIPASYDDFKSNFTYAQPGTEKIKLNPIATKEDLQLVKDVVYNFNWAKPYHAHLMLGALVQAPIAAALRWRAHVWIIGAQGSGKSFFQSSFVRKLLGQVCINFGGETTAAGVRQALKHNPFVVSFDEAEVRSKTDAKRMKDIISLARISSSDENSVVKGSASGDAMEYRCQSPFIMSSIKPFLREESDIARFAQLELRQPGATNTDRDTFVDIQLKCEQVDDEFSERWIAFCIAMFGQIEQNMKMVREGLIKKNLSPRTIDQYGQLIACAMAVNPSIDLDDFDETLNEAREHTADQEPLAVLNKLLSHDIKLPSKYGDKTMTLRDAVSLSCEPRFHDEAFTAGDLERRLGKYGLKVLDQQFLLIANKCDEIENILDFPEWNKLFGIIEGVERSDNPTTFGTRDFRSRYVKIPTKVFEYTNKGPGSVHGDEMFF